MSEMARKKWQKRKEKKKEGTRARKKILGHEGTRARKKYQGTYNF